MFQANTIHVFLSRPTWVDSEFAAGLQGFERLLRSMGLQAHTLGATEYASENPLDEVIQILGQCSGAIVLGYPQIQITEGMVRGQPVEKPVSLPTEWNQIEAALAYSRSLPLLIIHHKGVSRGVFDRGALNKFLYELDLRQAGWPLLSECQGALHALKQEIAEQSTGTRQPAEAPESRPEVSDELTPADLAPEQVEILRHLGLLGKPHDARFNLRAFSTRLGIDDTTATYHLEQLTNKGLVDGNYLFGRPTAWELTPEGRGFLVENKLL